MSQQHAGSARTITGRTVLIYFVAFFGIVAAMNAVLIKAATSTFGGVETENAYKAGLNFGRDIAASRAQAQRHWQVDGSVALRADGMAIADLTVNDSTGRSIDGLGVTVRLVHPTNRKLDREIVMAAAASGRYRGSVEAMPGQWDFVVELDRDGERSFNSRTRVTLK